MIVYLFVPQRDGDISPSVSHNYKIMEWNNNFNQEELEYYYTEKYLNGGYKGYIIKGFNVS